jgi:hypothetical protein
MTTGHGTHEVQHQTTSVPQDDDWLTVQLSATEAKCHPATIRRECAGGRLRFARIGGRKAIRIRRSWLNDWLERSATPVEVQR